MNKFEYNLQKICEDLLLTKEDRESYARDAEWIRDHIIKRMKAVDASFAKAFAGLSLTGSYLDRLKIDLPDEFDMHLKLKLPFEIIPEADDIRAGYVLLRATDGSHEFVQNGYICRIKIQTWIRNILLEAEVDGLEFPCIKHVYKLSYPAEKRGHSVAHTIIATDVHDNGREISFDFVPVFEFPAKAWPLNSQIEFEVNDLAWFAVPQGKYKQRENFKKTFKVCAPHCEREALKNKGNLKNSLRLMKALRDANNMPNLPSYFLKSVYLLELKRADRDDKFWQKSIGTLLLHMLESLRECLESAALPFHWDEDENLMERIRADLPSYKRRVAALLEKLKDFHRLKYATYDEMANLFAMQKQRKMPVGNARNNAACKEIYIKKRTIFEDYLKGFIIFLPVLLYLYLKK